MGEEWDQDPHTDAYDTPGASNEGPTPGQSDLDARIDSIRRTVVKGAGEAQLRLRRVVDRAGTYWQQAQVAPTPQQAASVEEERIRQLTNLWSNENWRVARELGTYMEIVAYSTDEVWEATVQTRWELRSMEIVTEPYTGRAVGKPQPLLPVWDYQLPSVTGLKPPPTRARVEGLDEIISCSACNGNGRVLCSNCNGRGWIVCPDCKGRTRKRCNTCRGRGYIADAVPPGEKKPFFQRQAQNVAGAVGGKMNDVLDNIRQSGVPIPNPLDADPAEKGRTIPCPDCINGEVDCTCGNGKRVCATCEGAKMSLCNNCGGTGKIVRHREISRRFELRTQTRIFGESDIPAQQLEKASGELVYSDEINETTFRDAAPEHVPLDIWQATVDTIESEARLQDRTGNDNPQVSNRPSLQVVELVRVPYTRVQYRFGNQEYTLFIYDSEGKEKFYAERYPARWDRIERLVKAISSDLATPVIPETPSSSTSNAHPGGYRVPIDYSITEEGDDEATDRR